MNILFIEPFYSGSHRTWLNQIVKHTEHHIQLLTLDGKFWKWRMYGSAYTLAKQFEAAIHNQELTTPDLIIVSDMLDLAHFVALSRQVLNDIGNPKVAVYFHENQLAYPWQEDSEDRQKGRDYHYGMMNYYTALTADYVLFNSRYNMESFYGELSALLRAMPDCKHHTIQDLRDKSTILPIGIQLPPTPEPDFHEEISEQTPIILWNHRLEHDKNPDSFFQLLLRLKEASVDFKVALLGETNKTAANQFKGPLKALEDHIVVSGYVDYPTYCYWLYRADILPVTSYHDFFGISIMEAVGCNTYPILPKRLTYPDLYDLDKNPDIFYGSDEELYAKTLEAIQKIKASTPLKNYSHYANQYLWPQLIKIYDQTFSNMSS